jgi:predicted metalloprotease
MLIEEMNSIVGKRNAAVMKNGVAKMRFVVVMKNGAMLIRSVFDLRNAEGLKSEGVLMKSASVRQCGSRRERRVSVLLPRGIAKKGSSVLAIVGLIALRWPLEPPPTLLLPDPMM